MLTAEKREATIQKTMVKPRGLNIWPDRPLSNARGMNTTQVVIVPPVMEPIIVRLPSMAAS